MDDGNRTHRLCPPRESRIRYLRDGRFMIVAVGILTALAMFMGVAVVVLLHESTVPTAIPPRSTDQPSPPESPVVGFIFASFERAYSATCSVPPGEEPCADGPFVAGFDLASLQSFADDDRTCYRAGDSDLFCSDPASPGLYARYELVDDEGAADPPNTSLPDWISGLGNLLAGLGAVAAVGATVWLARKAWSREKPPETTKTPAPESSSAPRKRRR